VFVEETLLRGYLQPAFIARWGTVAGILMTAAGFALYQLNPRPYALAAKFAFGIILGVLKGRDRSLFAPAVAHALLWNIVGTT
jgi:membrane protease YdiL (CAAX protease family)